ncbi:hypothetical protein OKW42_008385 [Paraburkholderia sp. WC7.3d]
MGVEVQVDDHSDARHSVFAHGRNSDFEFGHGGSRQCGGDCAFFLGAKRDAGGLLAVAKCRVIDDRIEHVRSLELSPMDRKRCAKRASTVGAQFAGC